VTHRDRRSPAHDLRRGTLAGQARMYGAKIRDLREERMISPAEFAASAGISKKTLHNAESGKPVRFATAKKVASALGAHPDDIGSPL
jgi:DNA-binding transcriptional regulator YiaG